MLHYSQKKNLQKTQTNNWFLFASQRHVNLDAERVGGAVDKSIFSACRSFANDPDDGGSSGCCDDFTQHKRCIRTIVWYVWELYWINIYCENYLNYKKFIIIMVQS